MISRIPSIEATSHMAKNVQPLKPAFWNEYYPQLCKAVMSCEGQAIKSSRYVDKLLFVISWVAIL